MAIRIVTTVDGSTAVTKRRGKVLLILAACLTLSAVLPVGCRPVFSGLAGVELLMSPQEVQTILGQSTFYIGDRDFRWSWYEGGVVVGYARSTRDPLLAVWILQTQGSLEAKLEVGATQSEAERRYQKASVIPGLAEPRIRLKTEEGATLYIVLENEEVVAFFLCLSDGQDPDIRLAGTGPGELPIFRLNHPESIDICPTAPGTTWVYEQDETGDGFYYLTYKTVTDTFFDGQTTTVQYRWERPDWGEVIETEVTILGDICFYQGRPLQPARLYAGLEWTSVAVNRHRAVGIEPIVIAAGQFPEALLVQYTDYRTYYVDGIGLVKSFGLELVEFILGPD